MPATTIQRWFLCAALVAAAFVQGAVARAADETLSWKLRTAEETEPGSGRWRRVTNDASWPAENSAVIVCDMWDLHHCLNATRRVGELAPRIDAFLAEARDRGTTIIHAPSSCMEFYADHPGRRRAQATPQAAVLPPQISEWCNVIPAEDQDRYPIDQSDGGEDDDLAEHAQWAAQLAAMGRNPGAPWIRQVDLINIDSDQDFISDDGVEIWSILEKRGIEHVALVGVHTNMCVLGRPFGLRQLAQHGKDVVLIRDLTDTMYNPAREPYVSHFTGTDLIVEYIEKYVCPTTTSDHLLGGKPLRFRHDHRPRVVIATAEQEYETERTLTEFAATELGKDFSVQIVYGDLDERNTLPGVEDALADADVLLLSVRRRWLPQRQMDAVRGFIESGGSVVGIRTASHAFSQRDAEPTEGLVDWASFDADVIGGSYSNHHGVGPEVAVSLAPEANHHSILRGVDAGRLASFGSLYQVAPLGPGASPLLIGAVLDKAPEPVAWTNINAYAGRVFYTSLGHPRDFEQPAFRHMLKNALLWAAYDEPRD